MDKVPLQEVCKAMAMDVDAVKSLAKERLTYQTDYFTHPKHRLWFTREAVDKLGAKTIFEEQPGDEVLRAKVCRHLPPNDRYVWIRGKEIEGKGTCQIPKRWAKWYRQPGKAIRVRHIDGNIYQIVHRDASY